MPKYKDYIPLPGGEYGLHDDFVKWIEANTKEPKWSWSRTQSKIYKRPSRPKVRLGVWLSPEDALAARLKFAVKDYGK